MDFSHDLLECDLPQTVSFWRFVNIAYAKFWIIVTKRERDGIDCSQEVTRNFGQCPKVRFLVFLVYAKSAARNYG